MTAFASLSLLNNAATAVVFAPSTKDGGVATWLAPGAVYDARSKVTMSLSLPKQTTTVVRIKQRVSIPIMDSIDATKKVGEAYVNIEAVIPKNASETTRLDLRKFADQLLMNAVSTAAYQNFENVA